MNIDIYTHFFPKNYGKAILRLADKVHPDVPNVEMLMKMFPNLCDLNLRLGHMERCDTTLQVMTPLPIPTELFVGKEKAVELAQIANDEMAATVAMSPDQFVGVALLCFEDVEAAAEELERAVRKLALKGAMIFTNIQGKPLDAPELSCVYSKATELDVPLWLHPVSWNYYEWVREYLIWQIFGWPIDTTLAMARLVYGKVFERHPMLKIITHHAGGTVPYLIGRVIDTHEQNEELNRLSMGSGEGISDHGLPPFEYFHQFYGDTALSGIAGAMRCAYEFFGSQKLLFGSDYPFGPDQGLRFIQSNLRAVKYLNLGQNEQENILFRNATALLKSTVIGAVQGLHE